MGEKFEPKDTLIFLSLFPYFQLIYTCLYGIKTRNVISITVLTDFFILTAFYFVILLCLRYRKFAFCKIIGNFQSIYWVNFIYVFSICIYLVITKEPVKLYGTVNAIYAINPNFLYAFMFIFMELFKLFMGVIFPKQANKEIEQSRLGIAEQKDLKNTTKQDKRQIIELKAKIADLERELEATNSQKPTSEQFLEYDGDIPLKTDKDKLAHTFKLIIQQSKFIEMNDGKCPTYSQLHTMLNHIYPNEPTPAKNTLKKYLEP